MSDKTQTIIYTDLISLVKKTDERKNDSEKTSIAKVGEPIPC